jgi:hypothetical protein
VFERKETKKNLGSRISSSTHLTPQERPAPIACQTFVWPIALEKQLASDNTLLVHPNNTIISSMLLISRAASRRRTSNRRGPFHPLPCQDPGRPPEVTTTTYCQSARRCHRHADRDVLYLHGASHQRSGSSGDPLSAPRTRCLTSLVIFLVHEKARQWRPN